MASWRLTTALLAAGLSTASVAWAQPDDEETLKADDPSEAAEAEEADDFEGGDEAAADEAAPDEEPFTEEQEDQIADAKAGNSPVELPGEVYYFVGARYRAIVVPKFMTNLFADGGATELVHGFGPEFAIREDGFEYNIGAWFGLYGTDPVAFKGKNDDTRAWELVESELKIFYLTSDFLWSHEVTPEFGINYGLGAGFGIVFGDLLRSQSFPPDGDLNSDAQNWLPCASPTEPRDTAGACASPENDHFGGHPEDSWANGGSKPNIFPWFALQTGLRYKPVKQFVGRLDVGFGTSGFFIGLGADYGI